MSPRETHDRVLLLATCWSLSSRRDLQEQLMKSLWIFRMPPTGKPPPGCHDRDSGRSHARSSRQGCACHIYGDLTCQSEDAAASPWRSEQCALDTQQRPSRKTLRQAAAMLTGILWSGVEWHDERLLWANAVMNSVEDARQTFASTQQGTKLIQLRDANH